MDRRLLQFAVGGGIFGFLSFVVQLINAIDKQANQYKTIAIFIILTVIIIAMIFFLITLHYKDIISELRNNNKNNNR